MRLLFEHPVDTHAGQRRVKRNQHLRSTLVFFCLQFGLLPSSLKVEHPDLSLLDAVLPCNLLFGASPEESCLIFRSPLHCFLGPVPNMLGAPECSKSLSSFFFLSSHKWLVLSLSYSFLHHRCMKIYHLCPLSSSSSMPTEE